MERIPEKLRTKVMSADDAARLIQPGMTIAVSGFTRTNYPKAVPQAVARQGTAKDLTLIVGAAVGDCIDGAWTRASLLKRRYGHQSNKDLRKAINADQVEFSDIHISHLPKYMNERTGPHIHIALIECCAITEDGLYLGASGGTADAAVRNADKVIVEVNRSLPLGFMSMHDIFEVGVAPASRIIPITHPPGPYRDSLYPLSPGKNRCCGLY